MCHLHVFISNSQYTIWNSFLFVFTSTPHLVYRDFFSRLSGLTMDVLPPLSHLRRGTTRPDLLNKTNE